NIQLKINGECIKYDNIIISKEGIFVLDIKNIGSKGTYTINIKEDGNWIKDYFKGKEKSIDSTLTIHDKKNIILLEKIINNKLNRSIYENYLKIEGIIVVGNSEVIKNYSNQPIVRASEIYKYIKKFKRKLDVDEIEIIQTIILDEGTKTKECLLMDYKKEIQENIKIFDEIEDDVFNNEKNNLLKIVTNIIEIRELINKNNKKIATKLDKIEYKNNYNYKYAPKSEDSSIDLNNNYEINNRGGEWLAAQLIFESVYDNMNEKISHDECNNDEYYDDFDGED
ncbi:MAG: hypothetical protein ACRC03_02205, partial [Romboutsia sp.]